MAENEGAAAENHPYGPGSHAPLENEREMPPCYPVKGNVRNDGSMRYHRPDSRSYRATIAEVWFDSPSAAEAAEFVLAPTHPKGSTGEEYEVGGAEHGCTEAEVMANRTAAGGGAAIAGAGAAGVVVGAAALDETRHPYGIGSHAPLADEREMPGCYPVKGNIRNDGSMRYHRPDSRSYRATKAEVWFDGPTAAEAAGFVLAPTHPKGSTGDDFEPGGSGHGCTEAEVMANRASSAGVAVDDGAGMQTLTGAAGEAGDAGGSGVGAGTVAAAAGAGAAAAAVGAAALGGDDDGEGAMDAGADVAAGAGAEIQGVVGDAAGAAGGAAAAAAGMDADGDVDVEGGAGGLGAAGVAAGAAGVAAGAGAAIKGAFGRGGDDGGDAAGEVDAVGDADATIEVDMDGGADTAATQKVAGATARPVGGDADADDDDGSSGIGKAAAAAGVGAVAGAAVAGALGGDGDADGVDRDADGAADKVAGAAADTAETIEVPTGEAARAAAADVTQNVTGSRLIGEPDGGGIGGKAAAGAAGVAGAAVAGAKAMAKDGSETAVAAGGAAASGSSKAAGAASGLVGGRGRGGDDDDDGAGGGLFDRWLWTVLGMLALVLLIALLLSQCGLGGDDDEAVAGGADEETAEEVDPAAGGVAEDEEEDEGEEEEEVEEETTTTTEAPDVDLEALALESLAAAGFAGIGVEVGADGALTLLGTLDSDEASAAAEAAVAGLDGIGAITNSIEVEAPVEEEAPAEEEPEAEAETPDLQALALAALADAGYPDVEVEVGDDGTVTLTGLVDSDEASAAAEAAVAAIEGVAGVNNELGVETPAAEPVDGEPTFTG